MNLSVIIPNYNGEDLLKKNLPKVIDIISRYKDGQKEVIVVDDASTDTSVSQISNLIHSASSGQISNLRLIQSGKNEGFSSTVNKGVQAAHGEIVILLNTDVIPEKGFLSPLLSHFNDDKIFAVGCMDKSIENNKTVLRGRGIGSWKRGFLIHARGEVSQANTLWVSGGSSAFRKSVWDKLSGLNILYNPFYWEDIDISYRAQKLGYRILFEPKSIVLHEHEKGAIRKKYSASQIKAIAYRNQFIFIWSNVTDLTLQFFHLFWLPYFFAKALLSRDWLFFIGFFHAFILLPKIMGRSFNDQKLFVKSDAEVTRGFTMN